MNFLNTDIGTPMFSFIQTCAERRFWAVEMGLCGDPVSFVGWVFWVVIAGFVGFYGLAASAKR